jgi:SAM-dependent methyltransferase
MHLDVVDLRHFYYATRLGQSAQRALHEALHGLWPRTRGMTVAGFGFAAPLLRPFLADAERVVSLMPAQQGVMPWPRGEANLSALVEETAWPIPAGTVDRLIVAHGLETCERPGALLDEIWRAMAPAGRVVFIVPNRSGLWARRDVTPFGYGRPYSFGQIDAMLRKHRFVPERHSAALYWPPSHARIWLRTARLWERLGRRFEPRMLAGALVLEASKQIYARPHPAPRWGCAGRSRCLTGSPARSPSRWPDGAGPRAERDGDLSAPAGDRAPGRRGKPTRSFLQQAVPSVVDEWINPSAATPVGRPRPRAATPTSGYRVPSRECRTSGTAGDAGGGRGWRPPALEPRADWSLKAQPSRAPSVAAASADALPPC